MHRSRSMDREKSSAHFYAQKPVDDGPMQPVNYSGTQVNIFGTPPPEILNQAFQQNQGNNFVPPNGQYPYGIVYPPNGFTNQVQIGLMTEHMLRKLDESRLLTMNELVRHTSNSNRSHYSPPTPYVQEPPSPPVIRSHYQHQSPPMIKNQHQSSNHALEYDVKPKQFSPGNGDWRGQLKHVYSHLLDIAKEDKNFRVNIGEPKLGEIVAADLEEDDYSYSLTLKFAKPRTEERRRALSSSVERRPKTPVSNDYRRPVKSVTNVDHDGQRVSRTISSVDRQPRTPASSHSVTTGAWSHGPDTVPNSDSRTRKPPIESVVKKQIEREENQFEKENIPQDGTLKPYKQFNAEADSNGLKKAMKGIGTDEDAITDILGKRSSAQRQEIVKTYKSLFGKDLIKELKSELSGNYWKAIQALCLTHAEYDASELRNAVKGLGTDDDTVIEIICTRTNKSLLAIQEAYKRLFNKNLEEDIIGDTSGHYQRLLVALLQANRDDSNSVDRKLAKKEAQDLVEAGANKWGTDESRFNAMLVRRSYAQLRATFKEFEAVVGKPIEEAIKSEMSGDLAKGMLTIVQCVKNKAAYFAQKLYESMKGMGTKDDLLIRILVSRSEVDMVQIKAEFQRQYKQSLAQFVTDDTSGDYRKILLTLLGESGAAKNA